VSVTGTYAGFSYPSIFTPLKLQPASGNILASYGYEYRTLTPWQITITINFLSADSVNNDSAYYAETENPTRYDKTTETIHNSPVTIMTDTTSGGFDKIAFLFHGSYSADISFNSEDAQNATEEQAALNQVLSSWQWK
jgi:hypothetical protein